MRRIPRTIPRIDAIASNSVRPQPSSLPICHTCRKSLSQRFFSSNRCLSQQANTHDTKPEQLERVGTPEWIRRYHEPEIGIEMFIKGRETELSNEELAEEFARIFKRKAESGIAWQEVSLSDPNFKFRKVKQIMQATGRRISDFDIHESQTAGVLFSRMRRKVVPEKLAQVLEAKQLGANVNVSATKHTLETRETKQGRWKIIQQSLMERNLPVSSKF